MLAATETSSVPLYETFSSSALRISRVVGDVTAGFGHADGLPWVRWSGPTRGGVNSGEQGRAGWMDMAGVKVISRVLYCEHRAGEGREGGGRSLSPLFASSPLLASYRSLVSALLARLYIT